MRILHVANFSWFVRRGKRADDLGRHYSTDRKLSAGLTREGHCVWDFSYRDIARRGILGKIAGIGRMNAELLQLARAFRPELVLLGHAELVSGETLSAIRDALPRARIAQRWVDPFWPRDLPHLREKSDMLDAFVSTSGSDFARRALEKDGQELKCPFFFMPNPVDLGVEIHRAFEGECAHDVLFAGAMLPERLALTERLRREFPDLRMMFRGLAGDYMGGAELHETIGASRTGLNLSQLTDVPHYASARMAQLIGNGCLALTPRAPGLEDVFGEDEVGYFSGFDELAELIGRLMVDDALRRRVARAGWERAHRDYNSRRVARFIVEAALGGDFSEQYGWEGF